VAGFACEFVIGDKAYDSDRFVALIEAQGTTAVIPPRAKRQQPCAYDAHLYRERHPTSSSSTGECFHALTSYRITI
jgi:transposase